MNKEFFSDLNKLKLPKNKFAIFGSGPLAIRGIRESKDIDIIVKKEVWDELARKYRIEGEKKNLIKIDKIKVWKDWLNLSDKIDEMIDNADIIEGLPFVKLKYLLEWKKFMGRDKDIKDIKLIEDYLENKDDNL